MRPVSWSGEITRSCKPSHRDLKEGRMASTLILVNNIAELNAAILAADAETEAGSIYTIGLLADINLGTTPLWAINLHSGVTLNINGAAHTLDGGGTQRGLFVYAG